jgi:hypothetical protein
MSNIDFDKLANEYLEEFKSKNPNPNDDSSKGIITIMHEISAKVCVDLLKKYEEAKSKEED